MPLYSIVTGDFQDPVLGRMRFKVESLQLKVKPGNRAEREEGTQLRSAKGTSVSRRIAKGRKTHGWSCRSRFIGAAGALRSECSPTTNSKWKPGAPGFQLGRARRASQTVPRCRESGTRKTGSEGWLSGPIPTDRGTPRVELSVPVHWCSCSLRSECSPTRNSKGKPGHPALPLGRRRRRLVRLHDAVNVTRPEGHAFARLYAHQGAVYVGQ